VINVGDDLPLGFKWFDWYSKEFMKATETIPIYGDDRGVQQYTFTVLDLHGNGMCCLEGQGSFSLYLGQPGDGNLIATGGVFKTDQAFTFEVGPTGLMVSPTPELGAIPAQDPTPMPNPPPTPNPVSVPAFDAEFYMSSMDGICLLNDGSKPSWVLQVFSDYDECCQFSWNKEKCIAEKPMELSAAPPTKEPVTPAPVQVVDDNSETESNTATFTPVTGSFTCKSAGMACTIKCIDCGSIKRVTSGMTLDFPDESTIVYTAERGSDVFPDDPSRLVLVESGDSASSIISCDEGCQCTSVNDEILGCGLTAKPIEAKPVPEVPYTEQPSQIANRSSMLEPSSLATPCWLLLCLWRALR
jgi:hypothetical protein